MSEVLSLDIEQIMEILPHRYPFLLVDRITECVVGEYSKGYKNLTFNEPFFQGHFPNNPVMPGVLQIEAMAQVCAPIMLLMPKHKGKLALFAAVDNVRFKNIVRPGDRFDMEAKVVKIKGPVGKCDIKGYVGDKLCVEATLTTILR